MFFHVCGLLLSMSSAVGAQTGSGFGVPRVARFYGGALGAVSLQFDDSMISQLQNALPLLNARNLHATFFINPARPQHQAHVHEWEVDVPNAGHELANHTLSHNGAKSLDEVEKEIVKCSEVLRRVYGSRPRLMTFGQPGGVPWDFAPSDLRPIFRKQLLVPAVNRTFFDETKLDPVTLAQQAIDRRNWVQIGMHGTGGEWLSTSVPTLTRLLDFLADHRSTLWTAPTIDVYKYSVERDAATPSLLTNVTFRGFSVKVDCDTVHVEKFGHPFTQLYDQPLTMEVEVPNTWRMFTIKQGDQTKTLSTVDFGAQHLARFDILPNMGPAKIERSQ